MAQKWVMRKQHELHKIQSHRQERIVLLVSRGQTWWQHQIRLFISMNTQAALAQAWITKTGKKILKRVYWIFVLQLFPFWLRGRRWRSRCDEGISVRCVRVCLCDLRVHFLFALKSQAALSPTRAKGLRGLWEHAAPRALRLRHRRYRVRCTPEDLAASCRRGRDNLPKELSHDFTHGQEFRGGL